MKVKENYINVIPMKEIRSTDDLLFPFPIYNELRAQSDIRYDETRKSLGSLSICGYPVCSEAAKSVLITARKKHDKNEYFNDGPTKAYKNESTRQ